MTGLCLVAGLLMAPLGETVTLRWTHSIEKMLWEEVWQSEAGGLRLVEARIRGAGAGMEPPPGARLEKGVWRYTPTLPRLPHLLLRHSRYVSPYTFCADDRCLTADRWLPGLPEEAILELAPCQP
jgi:hypothetical protein